MLQTRIHNLCNRLIGNFAGAFAHIMGEAGVFAPAHVAGVHPASRRSKNLLKLLWTALFIICLAPLQAVSANNQIINTATLSTTEYQPSSSSATAIKQTGRTASTIEFLKYAPGVPGAVSTTVGQSWYKNASGSLVAVNPPVAVGTGTPINLSSVPLIKTAIYHAGEPLFVRVTDPDQNLDKSVAETVYVTLTDPKTGDTEILKITETGPDTGIFVGYIQTAPAATGLANKGMLSVSEPSPISAHYIDSADPTDSSTDTALVDPFGIVFDSMTGKPVDGATVELLNADGTAATVFGDNGLPANSYPNKIVSGGTAIDHDNNSYSFAPGSYRFPFVNPGNYILRVTPPATYSAPSKATTQAIQVLPGAPFAILEPGSRGEVFSVASGPAIRVDIPLDPKIGTLWLSKSAGKGIVSAGEHVSYDITLENSSTVGTIFSPVVTDILPPGFRFEKGSVRINGIAAVDPAISRDGSSMTFTLANIPPSTNVT
ncbi:MAG: DUF11 domain-containing protein, partial [Geobacteraceae bacterium]|nr:DUF11 domain-containing protein [Geobacteraceae bacterium]